MNIVYKRVDEIIPYEKNPRINDAAVDAVAQSIKEFGFRVPIVLDKNNVIITGHTRLRSAKSIGLTEVPCIIAENLTPEQVQAYRIADNKTGEIAEWNYDLLPIELRDLQEKDFDLSLLGFDSDELDRLLNGSSEENVVAEGETDADAVPDVPEEPVSQPEQPAPVEQPPAAEEPPAPVQEHPADPVLTKPRSVAQQGTNPFPYWGQIVQKLEGIDPMLYMYLRKSKAYFDGTRVLIDGGKTFRDFIRVNKDSQKLIKKLIAEVSGVPVPIGPYEPKTAGKTASNAEQSLLALEKLGLEVSIEDTARKKR